MASETIHQRFLSHPATLPLTGLEEVPISQGNVTKGMKAAFLQGQRFYVRAFKTTGVTDAQALLAAATAAQAQGGGAVVVGVIPLVLATAVTFPELNGVSFEGAGQGTSIIKSAVPAATPGLGGPTIVQFSACTNVRVSGITFDGDNIVTTQTSTALVTMITGSGLTFDDCGFINFKRTGVGLQSVTDVRIKDCYFLRTTTEGSYHNLAIIAFSNISISARIWIDRCKITGASIELDANDTKVTRCTIKDFGYGSGIAIDAGDEEHGYREDAFISENKVSGGIGQDVNGFYCKGIECYAKRSTITDNILTGNDGGGLFFGAKFHTITGNVIIDNGCAANPAPAICNNYQTAILNGSHSVISGNTCTQDAGTYQTYAFADSGAVGVTTRIHFGKNNFEGNATASYIFAASNTTYTFTDPYRFSAAWTPGTIAPGEWTSIAVTTANVRRGDFVQAALSLMPNSGLVLSAYCYGDNVSAVVLFNPTVDPVTIAACTVYLIAEKRPF